MDPGHESKFRDGTSLASRGEPIQYPFCILPYKQNPDCTGGLDMVKTCPVFSFSLSSSSCLECCIYEDVGR